MISERFLERFEGRSRVSFAQYMAFALYDPQVGFYSTEGRAGRRADFLTSPEVGPLFGALVARRLDQVWIELGRPETFVVCEVGAGPGTLARSIALAAPECSRALRYLLVEISASQRASHADHLAGWVGEVDEYSVGEFIASGGPGPSFASTIDVPAAITGVVFANELLDNLPFEIVRHDGAGNFEQLDVELLDDDLEFSASSVTLPPEIIKIVSEAPAGEWMPWQDDARVWVRSMLDRIENGVLIAVDYGAPTAQLAERPTMGWLRTFANNDRGGHPLDDPGSRDITTDVALDQIAIDHLPSLVATQAEWLHSLGIEELVDEGRRIWNERAHAPDVEALRARSRIREAEALSETDGLGSFIVAEWRAGATSRPNDGR